jgi:hypothetical protein
LGDLKTNDLKTLAKEQVDQLIAETADPLPVSHNGQVYWQGERS